MKKRYSFFRALEYSAYFKKRISMSGDVVSLSLPRQDARYLARILERYHLSQHSLNIPRKRSRKENGLEIVLMYQGLLAAEKTQSQALALIKNIFHIAADEESILRGIRRVNKRIQK